MDRGENAVSHAWVKPSEVFARGRALREAVRPKLHDHAALGADRPGAVEFVQASNAPRLQELVPLRVGRMLASPFAFFRGAAELMAADLAATPASGITAQICGDAHAANFGLFGTNEGRIVMDINDFDETAPGPWEWDLKRLAVSLVLAGREGGVDEDGCAKAAEDAVRAYRKTMNRLAELPFLESWNALADASTISKVKADELLDDFEKASKKARKNTSRKVAAKWTRQVERDHWRFVEELPVLRHVSEPTAAAVAASLDSYVSTLRETRRNLIRRYSVADVAFRVVGTGSVGLRNYLVLLHGNEDDALVLQVKQANPSCLSKYLDLPAHEHDGKRVVEGARLVQAETDILLGWTTVDGRHYIVRQFRNMKGDIDPTALRKDHLDDYGRLAGALLARAHCRSADPRLIAGYCGEDEELDEAVTRYAVRYADATEADHAALTAAVQRGELAAEIEDRD
ncbi:DUF2252 domain-containing protein [Crossiella cryophila]|uniref:Uncharacterized protein (DUF2252 family) n=1 Tax=Crossiella cryophila TaxID=43355 RepID=A0A7W7FU37_9PSEU|nr:DUF2252 domain-containing protein [Crossiella cryophila]MBB4677048.1 uncharacterized protein (DUF2252 family) [Crossiella cryophila]